MCLTSFVWGHFQPDVETRWLSKTCAVGLDALRVSRQRGVLSTHSSTGAQYLPTSRGAFCTTVVSNVALQVDHTDPHGKDTCHDTGHRNHRPSRHAPPDDH